MVSDLEISGRRDDPFPLLPALSFLFFHAVKRPPLNPARESGGSVSSPCGLGHFESKIASYHGCNSLLYNKPTIFSKSLICSCCFTLVFYLIILSRIFKLLYAGGGCIHFVAPSGSVRHCTP